MWPDTAAEVHAIIGHRFRKPRDGELRDDLDLGPAGFGLDSLSLIELLLVCEEHFGCAFPATLFDDGPLTLGRLVEHADHARKPARRE